MPNVEAAKAFLSAIGDSHPSVHFTIELTDNSKFPFQRLEIVKQMSRLETKVKGKPTDTGLSSSYQQEIIKVRE